MVQTFGDQFLAGAAFTDHKNRAIERRRTARPLDGVEKGKALPHELIGPLHSLTVGVKAHELARYFGCFPSKNRALWRIIGQSAGLAQDLYSE
jgi:hypothetical protein